MRLPVVIAVAFVVLCSSRAIVASNADDAFVISHIPRAPVASTAIATVGYSKRRHILEIEFLNGRVYRYLQVDPATYRQLMAADSKTRFYDQNIRHRYASQRVRPRLAED